MLRSVLRLVGLLLLICVFAGEAQAQRGLQMGGEEPEEEKPLITPPKLIRFVEADRPEPQTEGGEPDEVDVELSALPELLGELGLADPLLVVAGLIGIRTSSAYTAAKHGVVGLTRTCAIDYAEQGIRVNAIAPGVVDGEHWDGVDAFFAKYEGKAPGQKKKEVGESVPYGRMGRAEDLTGMAVFLASDEANYIVAQCYNVDGGQWMS